MAEKDVCRLLNILSEEYDGAFPGRSAEGLGPDWPADPFHVLIATILSQRTRDENTRRASDRLFGAYGTLESLATADPEAVEELIRPAGFPKQKAKGIVDCCRLLLDEHGGEIPRTTEELTALPMVGRKTAACVMSYAMGIPAVCVDTHVHRIFNLMGFVDTRNPEETERELMAMTPMERWIDINRYAVRHGQETCLPNRPRCDRCKVSQMCDHFENRNK